MMPIQVPRYGVLAIRTDDETGTVMIEGVRYAYELFRGLGLQPDGRWMRIIERRDGVLSIHVVDGRTSKQFDEIAAYGVPRD